MVKKIAVVGGDKLYRGYGSGSQKHFQEAVGYFECLEDQGLISDLKYGDLLGKGQIILEDNKALTPNSTFPSVFGKDGKLLQFVKNNKVTTHEQSEYLVLNAIASEDTRFLDDFKKRFPRLEILAYSASE